MVICNNFPTSYREIPVTCSISLLLVIVFLVYTEQPLNKPCGNDMRSIFWSNFVTVDIGQLIINLYSLYSLSGLEVQMGSVKYLNIIILSLGMNTVLEWGIHKKYTQLPCSLGFSGVMISLIVISLILGKRIDMKVMTVLVIFGLYLTLNDNGSNKYIGHIVGALSGLIIAVVIKNKH
jgi:membrane associated rhomboid family serine protease